MGIDAVVFLKFAAILGGLVWLSRRAARPTADRGASAERASEKE